MNDDMERAFALYDLLASGRDNERLDYFVLPWAPASKSRPRFGKGGVVYSTREQYEAERRTALAMRTAVPSPRTGNVALGCIFFRPNRQRIDTDNMLKHVCDAANGVLWADDSQVTAICGITELDTENPRTVIIIGDHNSTMTRGTDAVRPCEVCGRPMSLLTGNPNKRACTKRCQAALRGYQSLEDEIPCEQCRKPFRRTTLAQRMCSPACRYESFRGKRRARALPKSTCSDCGKQLDHRRGGRCRECWRASVRVTETS